jgi:hypothetical protein
MACTGRHHVLVRFVRAEGADFTVVAANRWGAASATWWATGSRGTGEGGVAQKAMSRQATRVGQGWCARDWLGAAWHRQDSRDVHDRPGSMGTGLGKRSATEAGGWAMVLSGLGANGRQWVALVGPDR